MRENIKQDILNTARELFNEKGYQETTMREIADRLGISLGNLTYHYHKKEEMMIELLKRPSFLDEPPATNFTELFDLIQAMIDSLIVNRFFYTVDELGRSSVDFYHHNVEMITNISNHLEISLQNLSDNKLLVPWISEKERHAFTTMIMDSHMTWIKYTFYRLPEDQISYQEFINLHWYLLESHVEKNKITEYKKCFHQSF